jgi:hypothetical protein
LPLASNNEHKEDGGEYSDHTAHGASLKSRNGEVSGPNISI